MTLALVPHAGGAAGRLHVWLGVCDVPEPPMLAWRVDGQVAAPVALRPLAPVLVGPLAEEADVLVQTGFFRFDGLQPGATIGLQLQAGAEQITRRVPVPPAVIPAGPQDSFNVLLVSCFHRDQDKTGTAGSVLSSLKVKPHLSIFAGDQVYLDLPTLMNFPDREAWLANKFQNDYVANWIGDRQPGRPPDESPPGYPQVLSLAPGVFMPDDHEFWNNYPFPATVIQNSLTAGGRRRWQRAAERMYRAFQQDTSLEFGEARTLDFDPLSILLLDTRSQRAPESRDKAGDLLGQRGRKALSEWVSGLVDDAGTAHPRFGLLVTGQSLLSPAAGDFKGAFMDYEYPDYEADFGFMVSELERLSKAGLPVILATGDVHWGRVLAAIDPSNAGAPLFEVISSPSSLVAVAMADEAKQTWNTIKGLFGAASPWPLHNDPAVPPERFGSLGQFSPAVLERDPVVAGKPSAMRGNQAFMMRFARSAGGLDVRVTCYPLSGRATFDATEEWSTVLRLRPPRGV